MSDEEFQQYLNKMDALKKKPAEVKKIMISAGIITEKGNLRKPYRGLKSEFLRRRIEDDSKKNT